MWTIDSIYQTQPARVLIGSQLWSIKGQTHRWRKRLIQVWQLRDLSHSIRMRWFVKLSLLMSLNNSNALRHHHVSQFLVLPKFWRHLCSITEQTPGKVGFICQLYLAIRYRIILLIDLTIIPQARMGSESIAYGLLTQRPWEREF